MFEEISDSDYLFIPTYNYITYVPKILPLYSILTEILH